MTDLAERYLTLGLRFGRLSEGLVDAYFGPSALADAVAAEPEPTAAAVVADAEALLAELPDGWLRDQVTGVRTYAGVLAGETYSFADEVKGCYGIVPEFTDESVFEAAQARLSELLPGNGLLTDRYNDWRESHHVPASEVEPMMQTVIAQARAWTEALVPLPPGERIELELVVDKPWGGYQEYQGGLLGRILVNTERPRSAYELLHLAVHETYPGHQAERALKDHFLVRGEGLLEESIVLLPAPQSLISEGLAELAPELLLATPTGQDILDRLSIDSLSLAVEEALRPLHWAVVNAAMLHHEGSGEDEVRGYLKRWALMRDDRTAAMLRFISAPGNRTYAVVYPAGRDRCRAYVNGDLDRFRSLLTEQIRVGDL